MDDKGIPEDYISGVRRSDMGEYKVTHLYKGTFDEPGLPMCKHGWNRDNGQSYSILRNNVSKKGFCKTCMKRALQGLEGIGGI